MNNQIRSVLLIGFWGLLTPWLSGHLVANLMLQAQDLDLLAGHMKFLLGLHVFVLGLLYTTLTPKLSELRDMSELESDTRRDMKVIIKQLEGRLRRFFLVAILSVLVCIAASVVKENGETRFFLIFVAGNSVYFSVAILIVSFALLLEIQHCKTRILDHDRKKKKRVATLEKLEKDRAEGFQSEEKLEQYNRVGACTGQAYELFT